MQIAVVAAWDADDASAQGSTPSAAAACAVAAQQMLLQLTTDPRHGIAPPVKCGAVSSATADQPGALSAGQPCMPSRVVIVLKMQGTVAMLCRPAFALHADAHGAAACSLQDNIALF